MEYLIDILKITLPALLVLWATYSTMTRFFEREENRAKDPNEKNKETLTLRLKAYERLTLFLERINPDQLIQRTQSPTMNCGELQLKLLKTIRSEYEHNLTQQLYVSDEAWDAIRLAKESISQLINTSMANIEADAPSLNLAQQLIETYHSTESSPIDVAIRQMKAEVVNMLS